MCGRYGFSVKDAREVYDRFRTVNTLEDLSPRYNIAPGQMNPVIIQQSEGNKIGRMFWGLIPSWAKDDTLKFKTINARAEGIESKPTYRKPFRSQHCLVPATGFYEWDKKEKPSQPYYFRLKNSEIFAFAGLYDKWHDTHTGKDVYSYTIITTQANDVVSKVHPRMPVILTRDAEKEWLNPDIVESDRMLALLAPYNPSEMEAYPVGRSVNVPTEDSEKLILPLDSS